MKKRIQRWTVAWSILFCAVLGGCFSEIVTVDDYEFVHKSPQGCSDTVDYYVYSYIGGETELTIPLEYDGHSIVGLGEEGSPVNDDFGLSSVVKKLTIQKNIRYVAPNISWRRYLGDPTQNELMLEEICVAEDNEYFKSIEGVLFSKDGSKILLYPPAKLGDFYVVPESATTGSLLGNKNLKSIYIPSHRLVQLGLDAGVENIFVPESLVERYKELYLSYSPFYREEAFQPLPENWEDLVR